MDITVEISDRNYAAVESFVERTPLQQAKAPLFDDKNSLYELNRAIHAPNGLFFVVRVFSAFKEFFPTSLERWYLNHARTIVRQYHARYIRDTKNHLSNASVKRVFDTVLSRAEHTLEQHTKGKKLLAFDTQVSSFQAKLTEEKWTDDEIQRAVYMHCEKGDVAEISLQTLRKLCQEVRSSTESTHQRQSDWLSLLDQNHFPGDKVDSFRHSARFQPFFGGVALGVAHDSQELATRMHYMDLLDTIEKRFGLVMHAETIATLRHHLAFLVNCPADLSQVERSAYNHIEYVAQELLTTKYPESTVSFVLQVLMNMTAFGTRSETIQDYMALHALKTAPTVPEAQVNTQNGQILVVKGEGGQSVAKVRTGTSALGDQKCELLAYDVDHALGSPFVPPAVALSKGKLAQKYIAGGSQLDAFLAEDPHAAERIKSMNTDEVQAYLLFGLIRGRADGHGANTIVTAKKDGSLTLYDIDEEEDFLPTTLGVTPQNPNESKHVSKMAALGFPQGAQPLSRVLAKLFSWEGMTEKALCQLRGQNMGGCCHALRERIEKLITLCRFESQWEFPRVTPRDLYFLIYGKDLAYQVCKAKGHTDYEIFRNVLTCINDDQFPEVRKASDLGAIFDANVTELDSLCEDEAFEAPGEEELCPGDRALPKVYRLLGGYWCGKRTQGTEKMVNLELPDTFFDQAEWTQYKENCEQSGRPIQSFMLSYFLKGFAKRVARQLSFLYPAYTLDIVRSEDGSQCLRIEKPPFFVELDKQIWANHESGVPTRVLRIEAGDIDVSLYRQFTASRKEEQASSERSVLRVPEVLACLSNHALSVAQTVVSTQGQRYHSSYSWLAIEEDGDGYYLNFFE